MNPTQQASSPSAASGSSSQQHTILRKLKVQDFDRAGKFASNVAIAVEALWANRLRSLLTTLGIFIGVAAVIAALLLTQGVSASITNSLSSLGTNTITIANGAGTNGMRPTSGGATKSLMAEDAKAVAKIDHVTTVSPVISASVKAIYGNQNWSTTTEGVDTSYQSIQNWTLNEGDWFSTNDYQGAHSVVVLGYTTAQQLFSNSGVDPIGQKIQIQRQIYRVVGVLASKGGQSDDIIFMPFTTAQQRLSNSVYIDQITVQVDDSSNINSVQDDITTLLRQRHHILKGNADDFNLLNSNQLLQTASTFTTLLTVLLVGIAAISLAVGGIGIMNIMIVSVTERTREIGIRISIGAQREDIRNQFLIEALALSLAGGILGMAIGFLFGFAVTKIVGLPFVVSMTSLLAPFIISATIGVVFGYYPAARAARLDPIDALRSL